MPDSISGPCSPSAEGRARRNSSRSGPSSPAGRATSSSTLLRALSTSWIPVLSAPLDQGTTSGGLGFGEPGWLSTIAASSRSMSE
jgi:hypothetical protein